MSGFPAANGSRSEHERARDNDDLDLCGWTRLTVRGPLNPALEPWQAAEKASYAWLRLASTKVMGIASLHPSYSR